MPADEELLQRVARLVSEGEDVAADELPGLFAGLLDAVCLDPLAGPDGVAAWVRAQAGAGFAALWVQPCHAGRAVWELGQLGDATPVCTVLGYPQGQAFGDEVCFSTALMMACGVRELALVANPGALREHAWEEALYPLQSLIGTATAELDDAEAEGEGCGCGCAGHDHEGHDHGEHGPGCDCDVCAGGEEPPLVKVVVAAGALDGRDLCLAVDALSGCGPDLVVYGTETGPAPTVSDLRLVCSTVEPGVEVEVLGDVDVLEDALALFEAGATRVATPHAPRLLEQVRELTARA
jgi:deoxyribose-phosphate aldolase